MWVVRYVPGHKQKTSTEIIRAAARLFRKRGYAATGVDAVMAAVNLTAGGFYSHFRSKQDLLGKALDNAFSQSRSDWPGRLQGLDGEAWVREFVAFYLSSGHRDAPEGGCPMPSLTPEVGRVGGTARTVFERHLRELVETVAEKLELASWDRQRAISAIALCVGGLMLARTVQDRTFSDEILRACRDAIVGKDD